MMNGVMNFLSMLDSNWTTLIVIIGLCLALWEKAKKYFTMSKEEKIDAALDAVKGQLLKLMSDAEIEWKDYAKSGELKKSQVIQEIYKQFPILKEYVDQDELTDVITEMIEEEKTKMDAIINNLSASDFTKKTTESEE